MTFYKIIISLIISLFFLVAHKEAEAKTIEIRYLPYKGNYGTAVKAIIDYTFVTCVNCPKPDPLIAFPVSLGVTEDFLRDQKFLAIRAVDNLVRTQEETIQKTTTQKEIIQTKTIHFDFDSYSLTTKGKEKIKEFLLPLKPIERVKITGYTCDIGTQKHNDVLALKRAQSVKKFVSTITVNTTITAKGKGKCCYISKDKRLNRRAEIKIYKEKIK